MSATASVQPSTVSRRNPRKRRGAELALLLFAYGLALAAFAQVDLVMLDEVSDGFVTFAIDPWRVCRWRHTSLALLAPYADPVLLPVVTLLNGLGLAMIHRLELSDATTAEAAPDYAAQLRWLVLAVMVFVVVLLLVRDHRMLQRYTYTAMLVGLVLFILPVGPRDWNRNQRRANLGAGTDSSRVAVVSASRNREDRAHRLLRRLPCRQA